jgi:hypothetical protein
MDTYTDELPSTEAKKIRAECSTPTSSDVDRQQAHGYAKLTTSTSSSSFSAEVELTKDAVAISHSPESVQTGITDVESVVSSITDTDKGDSLVSSQASASASAGGKSRKDINNASLLGQPTNNNSTNSTSNSSNSSNSSSSKQATVKPGPPSSHVVSYGHRDSQIMDPDEPVFMGSKTYCSQFIFRQVQYFTINKLH